MYKIFYLYIILLENTTDNYHYSGQRNWKIDTWAIFLGGKSTGRDKAPHPQYIHCSK